MIVHQIVNVENSNGTIVTGLGELPRVHPNRITRARLYAHPAKHTLQNIDVEPDGVFLHAVMT